MTTLEGKKQDAKELADKLDKLCIALMNDMMKACLTLDGHNLTAEEAIAITRLKINQLKDTFDKSWEDFKAYKGKFPPTNYNQT